jgi:hypothetical protein
MLVIIVGSELGGLAGAIAAVPITAVIRDLYIYLYQRLALGASPLEAESHVPSRRDEIAAEKRRQAQRSLKRLALDEASLSSPSQPVNPIETLPVYDEDEQKTENK